MEYPIYSFNAHWIQAGEHKSDYPNLYEDLPEGIIRNSTGFRKIFREEKTDNWLDMFILKWWDSYKRKNLKGLSAKLIKLDAQFVEKEVWCLEWFSHYTFDDGQSDADVLMSFELFVGRKQDLNRHNGYDSMGVSFIEDNDKLYHSLMGAEDRWRWKGREPNGDDDESEPPCRCKHCKKQGIIRIGH